MAHPTSGAYLPVLHYTCACPHRAKCKVGKVRSTLEKNPCESTIAYRGFHPTRRFLLYRYGIIVLVGWYFLYLHYFPSTLLSYYFSCTFRQNYLIPGMILYYPHNDLLYRMTKQVNLLIVLSLLTHHPLMAIDLYVTSAVEPVFIDLMKTYHVHRVPAGAAFGKAGHGARRAFKELCFLFDHTWNSGYDTAKCP